MGKPILCLMGPTASGKTDLACALVARYPVEIISVDSAMIYRGMDIGTAKPDIALLEKAPHHLIDILDPPQSYSAAEFCSAVTSLADAIYSQDKIPLLVGGTMMYFRALQTGLSRLPQSDAHVRAELMQEAETQGLGILHRRLMAIDPIAAERIHPHDSQRIVRALEIFALTHQPWSELMASEPIKPDYQFMNVLLMPKQRAWLHERIGLRFHAMLEAGFIDEVEVLLKQWSLTEENPALRCVGYRQIYQYLHGEFTRDLLAEKGIAATRQLAKRQLTWLRHWPDGTPLPADDPNVMDEMMVIIQKILDNSNFLR